MLEKIKGERALEVLADIMEPFVIIASDADIVSALKSGKAMPAVKKALKDYKTQVIEILAALEGEPVKEYQKKITIFTVPIVLLNLFNDPEVVSLVFQSQELKAGLAFSISPLTIVQ